MEEEVPMFAAQTYLLFLGIQWSRCQPAFGWWPCLTHLDDAPSHVEDFSGLCPARLSMHALLFDVAGVASSKPSTNS